MRLRSLSLSLPLGFASFPCRLLYPPVGKKRYLSNDLAFQSVRSPASQQQKMWGYDSMSGLFNSSNYDPLPLDGVHVAVRIVNLVAEVQVLQFYVNDSETEVDCFYEYPLDENGAICRFEVELQDKCLIGEVKEKTEAKLEYEAAVQRGETAALLEQSKPDIFKQQIGNIPAKSRITIRIVYVTELDVDSITGDAVFVLPTSVAPRYSPSQSLLPFPRPFCSSYLGRRDVPSTAEYAEWDGMVEHLPWIPWTYYVPQFIIDEQRPGSFSVTIEAEMASAIKKMESKTHAIKTEKVSDLAEDAYKMVASFWNVVEPMGKDLVVNIAQEKRHEPSCQLEMAADGSGCAMLTVIPEFEVESEHVEIIFLVDCSGSMDGVRIAAARHALGNLLESLPPTCHFNIFRFGSGFNSMFESSVPWSPESLKKGKEYVETINANMGGTEILSPLKRIFEQNPVATRQLFVLTDGQVDNTKEVIEICKFSKTNTRVFTIGIGDEVSRHLVRGMARAGLGTAEFIVGWDLKEGDTRRALESKLAMQLREATRPKISQIDVNWVGLMLPGDPTGKSVQPADKSSTSLAENTSQPASNPATGIDGGAVASPEAAVGGGWTGETSSAQLQGREEALFIQAPFLPPPIFSERKFMMFCLFKKGFDCSALREIHIAVQITATSRISFSLPVRQITSTGSSVHLLAARALIRDLSESSSHFHWQRASDDLPAPMFTASAPPRFESWEGLVRSSASEVVAQGERWVPVSPLPASTEGLIQQEMIELGVKYGIVSSATSFVAVERYRDGSKATKKLGMPFEIRQGDDCIVRPPVLHGSGFMDDGGGNLHGSGFADYPSPSFGERLCEGFTDALSLAAGCFCEGFLMTNTAIYESTMFVGKKTNAGLKTVKFLASPTPKRTVDRLIALQQPDGSIQFTYEVAHQLGRTKHDLKKQAHDSVLLATVPKKRKVAIWVAVVFLKVLRSEYHSLRHNWHKNANRTRRWLARTLKALGKDEDESERMVTELIESA